MGFDSTVLISILCPSSPRQNYISGSSKKSNSSAVALFNRKQNNGDVYDVYVMVSLGHQLRYAL